MPISQGSDPFLISRKHYDALNDKITELENENEKLKRRVEYYNKYIEMLKTPEKIEILQTHSRLYLTVTPDYAQAITPSMNKHDEDLLKSMYPRVEMYVNEMIYTQVVDREE